MACILSRKRWRFFRCVRDGYWSARDFSGHWPTYAYSDAPDFQPACEVDWETMVSQARPILQRKFDLGRIPRGRFLDIGCSEGAYVAGSAALGWVATGVEIDEAKASRAQARGFDVRRLALPTDAADFPASDFVMLRHVLEHVPEFVTFAQAAASAVSPGGILWVECPNQGALSAIHRRRAVRQERYLGSLYPPTHVHAFEKKAFWRLGEHIGLSCERVITYAPSDHSWYPPHQARFSPIKATIHKFAATLGYGTNVAVIYRRNG